MGELADLMSDHFEGNPSLINQDAQRLARLLDGDGSGGPAPLRDDPHLASWEAAERIAMAGTVEYDRAIAKHDPDVLQKHRRQLGAMLFRHAAS